MGFVCIICQNLLTATTGSGDSDELVTTICGHLFHRKCLFSCTRNQNRGILKAQCPSCSRCLLSDHAVFKIYPQESDTKSEDDDHGISNMINDIMTSLYDENHKLKEQLRSLVCTVENITLHLKSSNPYHTVDSIESLNFYCNSASASINQQNYLDDGTLSKRRQSLPFSSCSSKSEYDSLITTTADHNDCLSDYYTKLIKTDRDDGALSLSPRNEEIEYSMDWGSREIKRKTYKSTRREFLTTRNKTSSWLTKMTAKGNKLTSEVILSDSVSVTQQIAEIKFFMKKIETHGIIIDRLKEVAKTLMNYEGVAPMEKNLTERCSKELERDFCDMHLRTSDRIVTLEIALIRCNELENFIEESYSLIGDVEKKLENLQEPEDGTKSTKKTKLCEFAYLMRLVDSHKTNIDAAKLSENDFRSCDNSQMLPDTESQLQDIYRRCSSVAKKLKGKLEAIIESDSLSVHIGSKHISRTPVFV